MTVAAGLLGFAREGGQSGTYTGFSPSILISPVSIIPPVLHTNHLPAATNQKYMQEKPRNLIIGDTLSVFRWLISKEVAKVE
jgi:hypothetical protein